jgi:hypothetical protein
MIRRLAFAVTLGAAALMPTGRACAQSASVSDTQSASSTTELDEQATSRSGYIIASS